MDYEKILSGLVRIGTVTDIDTSQCKARVKFRDTNMTSGWLTVLDNHPHIPDYDPATQRTGYTSGGSGDAAFASHCHSLTIKQWMPRVNDAVLCLYLPVFNGDGFILGGVR
jgi:hypothetical protein